MKDYLISMFVDNELNLDEKIEFVQSVHSSAPFTEETVELLEQEKMLQGDMVTALPAIDLSELKKKKKPWLQPWFSPVAGFATALALIAGVFLLRPAPVTESGELQHRFVIYQPGVNQAKIVGDFTHWSPVPMEKVGHSGYWTVTLPLPAGEHRYSYLVDQNQQIPDPTVLTQEQDDFGGKNTVINVAVPI
jgi:hypothetical protein